MSQRINLLRDGLEERQLPWSATHGLLLSLAALLLVGLWAAVEQRRLAQLRAQTAAEQVRIEAAQAAVVELGKALEQHQPSKTLPVQIEVARRELDGRRWLLAQLRQVQGEDGASALSDYLAALGRQRLEPAWLTAITLVAEADAVEVGLRGQSLDAETVPRYLQRLGEEPALVGREFSLFALAQPEQPSAGLEFRLATRCGSVALQSLCAQENTP